MIFFIFYEFSEVVAHQSSEVVALKRRKTENTVPFRLRLLCRRQMAQSSLPLQSECDTCRSYEAIIDDLHKDKGDHRFDE